MVLCFWEHSHKHGFCACSAVQLQTGPCTCPETWTSTLLHAYCMRTLLQCAARQPYISICMHVIIIKQPRQISNLQCPQSLPEPCAQARSAPVSSSIRFAFTGSLDVFCMRLVADWTSKKNPAPQVRGWQKPTTVQAKLARGSRVLPWPWPLLSHFHSPCTARKHLRSCDAVFVVQDAAYSSCNTGHQDPKAALETKSHSQFLSIRCGKPDSCRNTKNHLVRQARTPVQIARCWLKSVERWKPARAVSLPIIIKHNVTCTSTFYILPDHA